MNCDFIVTDIKRIIYVGKSEYENKVLKFNTEYISNELILHLSGNSTVKFNGKTLLCSENTIRFLPCGEVYEYTVNRQEVGDCIDIFFNTNVPISSEAFTLKAKNSVAVSNLFKKIFAVWVAKDDGYYFKCLSLLYEILAEIQKSDYIPENQYKIIKPAITYINANFLKEKISVNQLAKLCSVSDSYIKKLFIKKFGMPPTKYIIQLKINYACDLLRTNSYSVTEVSLQCGYENLYFFSRQFKEYTGLSPSDYVNKYKSSK